MPAKDLYHKAVCAALIKDGWTITHDPLTLRYHKLEEMQKERILYLAVPNYAQDGILSEPIGELLIRKHDIRLMVYQPDTEEVVAWKP